MILVAHLAALGDSSVPGCAHRHCSLLFPAPAPITKASRLHVTLKKSSYSETSLGSHPPSSGSGFIDKHADCSFRERAGGSEAVTEACEKWEDSGAPGAPRGEAHAWWPFRVLSIDEIS